MSHNTYDAIVLGVGGMGSAAAFELARRGRRVLGLEQFALGHDRGSSHGHTRIIRKAYYEHPDYVPLVLRAYDRWRDLERRCGRTLLTECPCLSIGRPDGELIAGVRAVGRSSTACRSKTSTPPVCAAAFPPSVSATNTSASLERSAGFLYVDDCVRAYAAEARRLGATIRDDEPVVSWKAEGGGVVVETTAGRYTAGRLVVTAGPWAGRMLGDMGARLTVMRQVVFWFGRRRDGVPTRGLSHLHRGDAGGRFLRPARAERRRPQDRPPLRGAGAGRAVGDRRARFPRRTRRRCGASSAPTCRPRTGRCGGPRSASTR